ncbi:hypothetical protein SAMN04487897_101106 [Paenibacillus sp. yr247]|nr:hypothetical protein [Paenibacillus sp. yr247]SDM80664.1 hypothetical protein SAMN04487897_101106 [Paenibacillus sp. yr247]
MMSKSMRTPIVESIIIQILTDPEASKYISDSTKAISYNPE